MKITPLLLFLFLLLFSNSFSQVSTLNIPKKNDSTKVKFLLKKSIKAYKNIGAEKALELCEKALKISDSIDYKWGIAEANRMIGILYIYESKNELALEKINKALDQYILLNDYKNVLSSYNTLGVIYFTKGNLSKAVDNFQKSILLAEKASDSIGISRAYSNIGRIFFELNDTDKALKYYLKSSKYNQKSKNINAVNQSNIGQCYLFNKDFVTAEKYFKKSLTISQSKNDVFVTATSYIFLGELYIDKKEQITAKKYYLKAIKVNKKINNKEIKCYILIGLSNVYCLNKDYSKATEYGEKAFKLSNEIKDPKLIKKSALVLYNSYKNTGRFKKSLKFNEIYHNTKDSIRNTNNLEKIAISEFKINAEKEKLKSELIQQIKDETLNKKLTKQKYLAIILVIIIIASSILGGSFYYSLTHKKRANKLLKFQKNEIRIKSERLKAKNNKLNELNDTKDKFFSIISHDLKNPFNTAMGLSKIIIENPHDYTEEKKIKYLNLIYESSSNAHNLLENLLLWSKAQTGLISYYPEHIDFKEWLVEMTNYFAEALFLKKLELKTEFDVNTEGFADKNMLEIVFRNLISNSIKFTPNNGQIQIKISTYTDDNFLSISISDNGIGIPFEKIPTLFDVSKNKSTSGTNNEKGTGLGLLLCKEFVNKNKGEIWVKSEQNRGTNIVFTVPVYKY